MRNISSIRPLIAGALLFTSGWFLSKGCNGPSSGSYNIVTISQDNEVLNLQSVFPLDSIELGKEEKLIRKVLNENPHIEYIITKYK